MKSKRLYIILAVEALMVSTVYILMKNASYTGASFLSVPFGFIGDMLRHLSLQGGIVNILSLVIYAVLCICPIILLLMYRPDTKALPEKIVLAILAPIMFFCLYSIINPQTSRYRLLDAGTVSGSVMAITIDSFILLYLILRLVRMVKASDKRTLYKYLKFLMVAAAVIIVATVCVTVIDNCVYRLPECESAIEVVGTVLETLFDATSLLLTLFVTVWAIRLSDTMSEDEANLSDITKRLCSLCYASIILCALSSAVMNVFHAVFIGSLNYVNAILNIPVFEIVFSLLILLFTRLLIENKSLREDNELFI